MKDKKVILLGLQNSGKTLLRMFMFDGCVVPEPQPTTNYLEERIQHKNFDFTIMDVGGKATNLWK